MLHTDKNLPLAFNPANMSERDLLNNFVVRKHDFTYLFDAIKNDIMQSSPQHFIIQGQRGYGKTTLLLKLVYEIRRDTDLSPWLIPVIFNEEQYHIFSLAKLWEEIIEILSEENPDFRELRNQAEAAETKYKEEELITSLTAALVQKGKKLVIFIDNFGEMIAKFSKKEKQRLREVLSNNMHFRIIGASSFVMEHGFSYSEPFYDFFRIINLKELDKNETTELLINLGKNYKTGVIENILANKPVRIEALRTLAGGVPRTIVLLFQVFIDDENGTVFNDLEMLLDKVTPLYKDRLDSLSTQQQAIVSAIALHWDAINTREIARATGFQSKHISAQLKELVKNRIVTIIETSKKNHLYQISERFFNIYCLMRLGKKRHKQKVLWLVKFFEAMYEPEELQAKALRLIECMKQGAFDKKGALFLTHALAQTVTDVKLQHDLIVVARNRIAEPGVSYTNEFGLSRLEVREEAVKYIKQGEYDKAHQKVLDAGWDEWEMIIQLPSCMEDESDIIEVIGFCDWIVQKGNPSNEIILIKAILSALIPSKKSEAVNLLNELYRKTKKDSINNLLIGQAYENVGETERAIKCYRRISEQFTQAKINLAILYYKYNSDFGKATEYFKEAETNIEKINAAALYDAWGDMYVKQEKYQEAEASYKKAIEFGSKDGYNKLLEIYVENGELQKVVAFLTEDFEKLKAPYKIAVLFQALLLTNNETIVEEKFLSITESEKNFLLGAKVTAFVIIWFELRFASIESAKEHLQMALMKYGITEIESFIIESILFPLLVYQQTYFVLEIFNKYPELKEQYKVFYFATLKLLGAEYADEFLRMPPEIGEAVDKVIADIAEKKKAGSTLVIANP